MTSFVHLHLHTEYSLLDGATRIKEIFSECRKMKMSAVAITDHGNLYGAVTFYKQALKEFESLCRDILLKRMKAENPNCELAKDEVKYNFDEAMNDPELASHFIKPIIGSEVYIVPNHKERIHEIKPSHLILLAKNEEGYNNLMKLSSLSFTEGFYGKPRIDFELLRRYHKGLICLSACLAGELPKAILSGNNTLAIEIAMKYKELFGEDYYLELQDHDQKEDKILTSALVQLSKELGIKLVATNDVHYLKESDALAQEVLMCINTQKMLKDVDHMHLNNNSYYLKSGDEMADLFKGNPEAIANTLEIADKCNVRIKFGQRLYPVYKLPPEYAAMGDVGAATMLRDLTVEGLKKKYKEKFDTEEVQNRMNYELDVIIKCNFVDYYLVVWDFVNYAKSVDVPVGPGRGSGAGSIVAYGMGITDIDPLKYGLFFERFLNPQRKSNPDFDIDFCPEGREKIHRYVIEQYGEENVCQIITFGTLGTKSALKDVGRVYDIPYSERNEINKLINTAIVKNKVPSIEAIFIGSKENGKVMPPLVPELAEKYRTDEIIKKVVDVAMRLDGIPKSTGMHAAGVVICSKRLDDYIPLQIQAKEKSVTTQFPKEEVEELGLLKMDFLAIITLTDIAKAVKYVKENHNVSIDFDELGLEDENVYKMITAGDVVGVFQLESEGMKKCMMKLKPTSIEDITAGISLYRPGPMDYIPQYIENKENPDKIQYLVPELENILGVTYGIMVYQEQVMQIVQKLAGFSLARADEVRRIMSKKKVKEMLKQKEIFINGCAATDSEPAVDGTTKRGISVDIAEKLFSQMESFASYAFNKSHAAAYSVLTYRAAYLKYYYEKEFFCAIINNRITKPDDRTTYVSHVLARKIPLFGPDINKSDMYFYVENDGIRYGLLGIKNVGSAPVADIIEERNANGPFMDFSNFFKRMASKINNKKMVESLIKAGAFDCFGETRATMLANYENVMNVYLEERKAYSNGQLTLFMFEDELDNGIDIKVELIRMNEMEKARKLADEKDMLGIYYSEHPLSDYRDLYKDIPFTTADIVKVHLGDDEEEEVITDEDRLQYENLMQDKRVVMAGQITNTQKRLTKSGGFFITADLEDLYGVVPLRLNERAINKFTNSGGIFQDGVIVKIEGNLTYRDNVGSVSVFSIDSFQHKNQDNVVDQFLLLRFQEGEDDAFSQCYSLLLGNKGNCPVYIMRDNQPCLLNISVSPTDDLVVAIADIIGADRVERRRKH